MRDWMAEGLPAALVDRMAVEELAPPFTRFDAFKQVLIDRNRGPHFRCTTGMHDAVGTRAAFPSTVDYV
jgi:hypothetical protein